MCKERFGSDCRALVKYEAGSETIRPIQLKELVGERGFWTSDPLVPNYETTNSKCFIWCRLGNRYHYFSRSVVPEKLYRRTRCSVCSTSQSNFAVLDLTELWFPISRTSPFPLNSKSIR